jgi:TonB C terminal
MSRAGRSSIPILGVFGTVLVHLLLLAPVLWGGGAAKPPRPPDRMGASANAGAPVGSSSERMILIDLTMEVREKSENTSNGILPVLIQPTSLLKVLGPDSLPMKPLVSSPDGEAVQTTEADLIARTQLVGLYEGQIRARIERGWLRPRSVLPEEHFDCRVKISQDARGNIVQVALQECPGPAAWQDSIVRAVKSASPLPAPPDPAVFVDAFQMSFHSRGFVEGSPEEGFEPFRQFVAASDSPTSTTDVDTASTLTLPAHTEKGVYQLKGRGDRIEWTWVPDRESDSPR